MKIYGGNNPNKFAVLYATNPAPIINPINATTIAPTKREIRVATNAAKSNDLSISPNFSIKNIAQFNNQITYDFMTKISPRVKRIYKELD